MVMIIDLNTALTRKRRPKAHRQSKRTELWYRGELVKLVKTMQSIVVTEIKSAPINDAPRKKQSVLSLTYSLTRALQKLSNTSINDLALTVALGFIRRGNTQNKQYMQSIFKAQFGVDLTNLLSDEVVKSSLNEALEYNVSLIKTIHTDFINDIGSHVMATLNSGSRHENIIGLIRDRGAVTERRARVIARDQASKLNAALNKQRHLSLGLDIYTWLGVGDDRERDSHSVLNGMLCKYSDPTVYSSDGGKTWRKRKSIGAFEGGTGEDYQCRCIAMPQIE